MNQRPVAARKGALLVALATVACLLPFVNKAFHIDDTLFLWAAEHIQSNPFDFYGFSVNWYGPVMSMAEIFQNPPLTSYFIALVSLLFGWQESTLHLAFLLPTLGVSLGIHRLAIQLSARPVPAALVALAMPVFIVSATNIMSDTLMLAFYIWAIIFWIQGLERQSLSRLAVASLLVTLAGLSKYFGLTAIPLLIVYTLFRERLSSRTLIGLTLLSFPVLVMLSYELLTRSLYDRGLLTEAVSYSLYFASGEWGNLLEKSLAGLSFVGGNLSVVLLLAPLLWRRYAWLGGGLSLGLLGVLLAGRGELLGLVLVDDGIFWLPLLQLVFFIGGGIHILLLAVAELLRCRDAKTLMLFCWVFGTFLFATFLNWTINGRSILPMVPAVALLVAQRLDDLQVRKSKLWAPLALGLAISLAVTWGDYRFANAQRQVAREVGRDLISAGNTVWFMGHWGFQHYMEQQGGRAVDVDNSLVNRGDYMIVPGINTNLFQLNNSYRHLKSYTIPAGRLVTTMSMPPVGAGFYASSWGPLPYVFGAAPAEEFKVFQKIY